MVVKTNTTEIVGKNLDTAFKVAQHLNSQTQAVAQKKFQRHREDIEQKVNKLHDLVSRMIKLKFERGLDVKEEDKWATEPNKSIENYENSLEIVEDQLRRLDDKEAKKREEIKARK